MAPGSPTPTEGGLPRRLGDFATLADALDYAARGETGLNFYNGKGELSVALPYHALRADALSLARRLLRAGLVRGDRVAIVAETHADVVAAFFACQYAGLIPALLPLPPAFGGKDAYVEHIRRLVAAARASALSCPAVGGLAGAVCQRYAAEGVRHRGGAAAGSAGCGGAATRSLAAGGRRLSCNTPPAARAFPVARCGSGS